MKLIIKIRNNIRKTTILHNNILQLYKLCILINVIFSILTTTSTARSITETPAIPTKYKNVNNSITTQVFHFNETGAICTRIPSMIQLGDYPSAPILAVAECRYSSHLIGDDCMPDGYVKPATPVEPLSVTLCSKISHDNGQTWTQYNNNITGFPASQNPTLTYDTVNKRALLVFNKVEVWLKDYDVWSMYTTDGMTWSTPNYHLDDLLKTAPARDQTSPGPGNGVQVSIGKYKGRILIPVYFSECGTGNYTHPDCSAVIYSDDGGDTFQSSTLPSSTGGWFQGMSESTIAEGKDGTIIVNMRNSYSGLDTAPCNCRGYAISTDGGETFGELQYDHELYDPGVARGCQGSFIGIDLPGRGRELFFSNPHNKTSRVGLIVQANNASGSGEGGEWVPYYAFGATVPAAYSCLAAVKRGDGANNLGLLFETSVDDGCTGMCQIAFLPIDLS